MPGPASPLTLTPLAPPEHFYDAPGDTAWHPLTPRLAATALTPAAPLPTEGARLPHGAPPEPHEFPVPLVARPRYLVKGRNVLLAGQRALIDPEAARLVNDTLLLPAPYFDHAAPLSRFPAEFKMTPAAHIAGETLRLDDPTPAITIETPVVALASTEARNYGSWLFRILPKLLTLDRLGRQAEGRALLLPLEQPFMREIAAAFAPGWRLIAQDVTAVTALSDVLLPSLAAPANIVPPDVRVRLLAFAEECRANAARPGAETSRPKRLYVSRRKWSETVGRRRLVNEDALAEALAAEGFAEVFPETLPLAERAALFAGAEIVAGPTGSGLFNTVFCRPGTRVLEFEPHGRFRAMHANLYRSLGLIHAFLRGTPLVAPERGDSPWPHAPWQLDLAAARALVMTLGIDQT